MAARQVATATMPWAHPDFGGEVMHLKLAPGTVSGFKGVHKAAKKWEARRWVAGRGTRVVWPRSAPSSWRASTSRPVRDPDAEEGQSEAGREGQVRWSACSAAALEC